jgi:hypothetical protein
MTRAATFTKAQIRRAVAGAEASGLRVTGVVVHPDGAIEIRGSSRKEIPATNKPALDSWDDA